MKNELSLRKKIIIFVTLMSIVFGLYGVIRHKILYPSVYKTDNEYVSTIDCAPIIDQYGVDCTYIVECEIKAEIPGMIRVYFIEETSRYAFLDHIAVSTDFEKISFEITPKLVNEDCKNATLSFWGYYGTGVIPTVKNISIRVKEE